MPQKPLVSFVLLSYNYGRFLRDCINSILSQEGGHNFEIVLIDDASTDESEEVARSYSDPRINLVRHKTNLGHITAVQEGLTHAQGTFIARIDADDRYRPYFLSETLEKFFKFPEVGLVYGDAALINEDGQITLNGCDRVHKGKDFNGSEFIKLLENNFICSPTVIARREAWQKALPVPEGLAFHDWYFTLMMAREFEFYYINRILADYRVHSENLHFKITQDKSEETSIFWLLDHIFIEHEKKPELHMQKEKARPHIYATQYLTLANKYFGLDMSRDARRCYIEAIKYKAGYLFRFSLMRRLVGTLIGMEVYKCFKFFLKKALAYR